MTRLQACDDIHGEADVVVVVDVACYGALPRVLPHLYCAAPARAIAAGNAVTTAEADAGAGVGGSAAGGSAAAAHIPGVDGRRADVPATTAATAAAAGASTRSGASSDVVDWGGIHESLARAYFLNNTLLARDGVASRLTISRLAGPGGACTAMDGAVWDGTRFFLDRLDGRALHERCFHQLN